MTLDELAHWIADTRGSNRQGGAIWNAIRDRALDALGQAFEMGRVEQPALPQLREDQFLFTYPLLRQCGLQVAEITGVCTVAGDGSFLLWLYTSGEIWTEAVLPEFSLEARINKWLRTEMAESIALARDLGQHNTDTRDRAVAELAAED